MSLIEDGRLTIPLYHATSTLFAPSILASGLGGSNIIDALCVISFLEEVADRCDQILVAELGKRWRRRRLGTRMLLEYWSTQTSIRLSGGYLSAVQDHAVAHALTYKYGSALISRALELYVLLSEADPASARSGALASSPLVKLLDQRPEPILVRADHVLVSMLTSEMGGSPHDTIQQVATYLADDGRRSFVGLAGFALAQPLPPSSLTLYRIRSRDTAPQAARMYELSPYRPAEA